MGNDFDLIPPRWNYKNTRVLFVSATSENIGWREVMGVEEAQIFDGASYEPQKYLMGNLYKMSECLEGIAWWGIKWEV